MLFLVLQKQVIQVVMFFHEITPLLIRGAKSHLGFILRNYSSFSKVAEYVLREKIVNVSLSGLY